MAVAERAWHPAGSDGAADVEIPMQGERGQLPGSGKKGGPTVKMLWNALVPVQNCRLGSKERFSTKVATNPSWERSVNGCMSIASAKEGANMA